MSQQTAEIGIIERVEKLEKKKLVNRKVYGKAKNAGETIKN